MALYRISTLLQALEGMRREGHDYAEITQDGQDSCGTFEDSPIYAEDAGLPEEVSLDPDNYDGGELDSGLPDGGRNCLHIDPLYTDEKGPYRFGREQYIDSVLIRKTLVSGAVERDGCPPAEWGCV